MAMLATSLATGPEDPYSENFGVAAVTLVNPTTSLDAYHLQNIGALVLQVADFHFLATGDDAIDRTAAKWLTFTYSYQGQTLECLEYLSLCRGRAYVVICTMLPDTYHEYEPLFSELAHTLDMYDNRAPGAAGLPAIFPEHPGPLEGVIAALQIAARQAR
jgi:hypothetical protein